MMNQWHAFLAEHAKTPRRQPAGGCRLFDLSHLGLIAARGADAETFLQGQLTNDIRELSPTHSQLSAHCSHKGRVMAVFRMIRREDGIYLQTSADRVADILKRLGMYVLRSQVTLSDATDDCLRMGLAGDASHQLLAERGLSVPEHTDQVTTTQGLTLVRLPSPTARFEILGTFDQLKPMWEQLAEHAEVADADAWRQLDIQAGLPSVYADSSETFVPQMLNLQLANGVSFNKGCYTGQEVVARMQFLGKLKRRMYLTEADLETRPAPGEHLYNATSTSQQSSGWIVDAAPVAPGRFAILAVAEIDAAEQGEIRLGEDGPTLNLQPPPYGFAD